MEGDTRIAGDNDEEEEEEEDEDDGCGDGFGFGRNFPSSGDDEVAGKGACCFMTLICSLRSSIVFRSLAFLSAACPRTSSSWEETRAS